MKFLRNTKITVSIGIVVAVSLLIGFSLNFIIMDGQMDAKMTQESNEQFADSLAFQEQLIEDYVADAERYLMQFSMAKEVKEAILKGSTSDEFQAYIGNYYNSRDNVENVYVADINSKVIASYVEPAIGKVLREGDRLTQLHDALKNGLYNAGIMTSGSTGQQILSLYYPIYDNDKMIGFAGVAVYTQNLQAIFDELGQNMMLIDSASNTYIFNEDYDKIGGQVEDTEELRILGKVQETDVVNDEALIGGVRYRIGAKMIPGRTWVLLAYKPYAEVYELADRLHSIMLGINVVTFAFVLIVLIVITSFLLKDITKILNVCNVLRTLDLRNRENLKEYCGKSETGKISASVLELAESLAGVLSDVRQSETNLSNNVEAVKAYISNTEELTQKIVVSMSEISQGASDQAEDILVAAEEVSKISDLIEENNVSLANLKDGSAEMELTSQNAIEILNSLSQMSETTEAAISLINEKMDMTNKATEEIAVATDLITNIASQTNLLAINASIEAARAGDSGRGFAVVAEEIKMLSDQSEQSASKIRDIISSLISTVEEANEAVKNVSNIITRQNKDIEDTEKAFSRVMSCVKKSEQQVEEISNKNDVLGEAKDTITELITNLSAIAQENAAMSCESNLSMEDLGREMTSIMSEIDKTSQVAEELNANMGKFII
ncbi:MAG: methyl-accepting chemotaxis protein [Clostridiales bacterium]|nr:methyl-accepting chemotaxis protein [Clostridiales bacterium]